MKKFSPPEMKEVSFPYTPHPTPYTLFQVRSEQELPELHFLRQTTEFMSDYLKVK
ncbi:MAG: hypothetical protein IM492_01635 [Microcystis sp. M040S2]|jgi:hypothetical protein|uniref:hypothetical protein n=1 Tax=unclassified Microcystis TaxID=2643300 RepID=UPI00258D3B51|nr:MULTISPECIES: hypothetical protein [unclassified Microcystis]MCA2825637.1 hypothetical protein [Microcystis sp. M088S1]MCA2858389.1 hypothetical protein [Microcystis sp. M005S1]MCA2928460.1 hypothetical protein [Microcystis sp. M020S1]MCA2694986.1 hypothetical protein [Microcystis sp. M040S2]MCA2851810.1 hypothetical protein [Microcystis sp. M076S1]